MAALVAAAGRVQRRLSAGAGACGGWGEGVWRMVWTPASGQPPLDMQGRLPGTAAAGVVQRRLLAWGGGLSVWGRLLPTRGSWPSAVPVAAVRQRRPLVEAATVVRAAPRRAGGSWGRVALLSGWGLAGLRQVL